MGLMRNFVVPITLEQKDKDILPRSSVGLALNKGGRNAGRDIHGSAGSRGSGLTGNDTGKQFSVRAF